LAVEAGKGQKAVFCRRGTKALKSRMRAGKNFKAPKTPWSRPLADLIGPIIDPVLAKRGFGQSDILLYWDEIVGERLASMSQPIRLNWPPRPRGAPAGPGGIASAALVVRVETGFALELQHLAGSVIDRVNAHLGWRCVDRLLLQQGPLEPRGRARPAATPPDPASLRAAQAAVGDFEDDALHAALTRLGACVLSQGLTRTPGGEPQGGPSGRT
jgi:hypothetical protein